MSSDSGDESIMLDPEEQLDESERPASPHYNAEPLNLHTTRTRESVRSRSVKSPPPFSTVYPPGSMTPKERFRRAVRKVIALHHGANVLVAQRQRSVGAEPGVDVLRGTADVQYGGIREPNAVIEIADYSSLRSNVRQMSVNAFVNFMEDVDASEPEPWVKVRWINIGGLDWQIIKALAIRYDLHPLALEDILHAHPRARSKVDYYNQHLFMRILAHELSVDERDPDPLQPRRTPKPALEAALKTATAHGTRATPIVQVAEDPSITALKRQGRVAVNLIPMFTFLLRNGTVITMHATPTLRMTDPITARVRQFDSGLRTSADASLLVQSLLALVVDMSLEVINAYQARIRHFERQILTHLDIETVRDLHVLSADLSLHRRTLEPIGTVITGLRRYDVDRVAALLDHTEDEHNTDVKVVGYMSKKAQVYLADTSANMDYMFSQLDTITGTGGNLVNYTFNLTSYEMNEVMRRLTLASIIFLPLTLLAGYGGMNFNYPWTNEPTNMWLTSHNHADGTFWAFAIPMLAVTMVVFLNQDLRRMASYIHKKMVANRAIKNLTAR
uniref:CorA-like protein n=1 Tax=Mycena chlorophos TaxID=658473 RepID=A0ABQ0LVI9_MYCCL|nr:CorA-like protein [Mycena chlorophos]